MWTNENRVSYDRRDLRYPSDLTDAEWVLVEPLIRPAKRGGNKRRVDVREIVNGLMYILSTGCHGPRHTPARLPKIRPRLSPPCNGGFRVLRSNWTTTIQLNC